MSIHEHATRPHTPDRREINANGRESTVITLKRACNGCGQQLGDASRTEIDAGINGLPLPDVRDECPNCSTRRPESGHANEVVEVWNRTYPVGAPVAWAGEGGRTRSKAWVLHRSAVVLVESNEIDIALADIYEQDGGDR